MTLGKKVLASQVSLVVLPAALISVAVLWRAEQGFEQAASQAANALNDSTKIGKESLTESGLADLTHQAQTIYAMCAAQQELLEQKLHYDLNVARDTLSRAGAVTFSDQRVTWQAVNQFTGAKTEVELPQFLVGGRWLGQNDRSDQVSPVVDQVKQLVGGTCTIFQRMNPAGDMLRVCTNVTKKDGSRAVGTYIPATNADGTPNPVVSAVLKGEKFQGRAFVVDSWYITAYEPLKDASGEVIGMLYVGVPEQSASSLRQAIMAQKVGKTGYV